MKLGNLLKIAENLLKHYPPDAEVWLDDENVMVAYNGERQRFDPYDVLEMESDAQIVWDGISAVRAWVKGKKERIYFRCVGVPESAHRNGKVFLEKIHGQWAPNMRYQLMVDFANQLNEARLLDAEEVQAKYEEYISK